MRPERLLRGRLAPWLLSALLLAAQQWALWHPLQHLPQDAAAHAGHVHDETPSAEGDCQDCLALAALALAVPPTAQGDNERALACAVPGGEARHWLPSATLARHNRGPPQAG